MKEVEKKEGSCCCCRSAHQRQQQQQPQQPPLWPPSAESQHRSRVHEPSTWSASAQTRADGALLPPALPPPLPPPPLRGTRDVFKITSMCDPKGGRKKNEKTSKESKPLISTSVPAHFSGEEIYSEKVRALIGEFRWGWGGVLTLCWLPSKLHNSSIY